MKLELLDWSILFAFFAISLIIGIVTSKSAGKDSKNFFLSGRNMPWWLLGVSMVATTFAADTPNLVAGIVRADGVSGNWVWWAFLLTGMLTVFIYAKLWRKSGITTDLEFYELRYKGKSAAFLRGFRAIYLGVFFNVITMATVCLAAIKIGHVMLGLTPTQTLLIASVVTVIYSALGGLKGILITDFFQFIIAMVGSVWATVYIIDLPQIGGMEGLLDNATVASKMDIFPDFTNPEVYVPLMIIPLAVQWWSVWYPGAEPGGGGYIAQRMLAAKDEKHATFAVLFFNFAHYALRPWPWIIIGLASLIVFPNLESLQAAFPHLPESYIRHDLSYPAMLTLLPAGILGLVITSLIAAFMSTISTHLNWGSSYIVNDLYVRFIKPDATQKQQVIIGRISTVVMMLFAALLATVLEEAKDGFNLLLQIGAGTGLLFILRWFWSKINPWSEIVAMTSSFLIAFFFFANSKLDAPFFEIPGHWQLVLGVAITTAAWVTATLLTKENDKETLANFNNLIFGGESKFQNMQYKIIGMLSGIIGVYSALIGTGYFIYGNTNIGFICTLVFCLCGGILIKFREKVF